MSEALAAAAQNISKPNDKPLMERIVSLAKRRGFIFQASEIYGGMNGVYDYGPLGAQLKKNFKDMWWRDMVECPPIGPDGEPVSIVGLDSAILQLRQVWDTVGHTQNFNDLMTDDRETKQRYRADHLLCIPVVAKDGAPAAFKYITVLDGDTARDDAERRIKKLRGKHTWIADIKFNDAVDFTKLPESERDTVIAPDASEVGTLTEPRAFNLMFETYAGVFREEANKTFLRPETCQGIFTNFKNVLDTSRVKPPFGIAQIGKAFRNEVTPRNFTFRSREFEQMELEFFCAPEDSMKWFEFWVETRHRWWQSIGLQSDNLFKHTIAAEDRAFYSQGTVDLEYRFPFTAPGFGELEGVAHRGDFDLTKHQEGSRQKLDYFDQEANKRYLPHVIEPSAGCDRGVLTLLCEGYKYDESRPSPEWLKIDPRLAPVKLGIFPLVNKDGMPEVAEKLYNDLRTTYTSQFDAKQSIGKRYARMDECGTPYCITVDGETAGDNAVTIRDRDTASQERVGLDKVKAYLAEKFS